jgi:hypothetical protein
MIHPTYPHEGTANQFFSESQFESYRALGFTIAASALDHAERDCAVAKAPDDLRERLSAMPADAHAVTESTMTLREIVGRLEYQLTRVDLEPETQITGAGVCPPAPKIDASQPGPV